MKLAAGAAEVDVNGPRGSYLYVHLFVFKTLAGAKALTPSFLAGTRLRTSLQRPSGAPGEQGEASSQPYGHRNSALSYRYAFRQQNVLAYVELDGRKGKYSLADAVTVAAAADARIQAALQ